MSYASPIKVLFALIALSVLPVSHVQAIVPDESMYFQYEGERLESAPVEDVEFEGVSYTVDYRTIGGVQAWYFDNAKIKELWENTIYTIHSHNGKADLKDAWITKLEVAHGVLLVTNANGAVREVDLSSGEVLSEHSPKDTGMAWVIGGGIAVILVAFGIYRFFLRR